MKRTTLALLLALLTALTLTACGGGGSGSDSGSSGGSTSAAPAEPEFRYDAGGGFQSTAAEQPQATESEEESRLDQAKIIYSANIEAETTGFEDCAGQLEALVARMQGYMEYASVNSYSSGYRYGSYTIRVPSRQFQPFLESVGEIGHVVYQEQSGENISEQYYDLESRLSTQRTKLERLQALLARAESMEDIITIESAIAETELAIEQLTGSLRHYDALVDYATIHVQLREVSRLTSAEVSPPTFGDQMGSAFFDGLASFGDFLQGLAIFLAYSWIWLLLLAVLVLVLLRISRRRQAAAAERWNRESFFRQPKGPESKKPDDKRPKD